MNNKNELIPITKEAAFYELVRYFLGDDWWPQGDEFDMLIANREAVEEIKAIGSHKYDVYFTYASIAMFLLGMIIGVAVMSVLVF